MAKKKHVKVEDGQVLQRDKEQTIVVPPVKLDPELSSKWNAVGYSDGLAQRLPKLIVNDLSSSKLYQRDYDDGYARGKSAAMG